MINAMSVTCFVLMLSAKLVGAEGMIEVMLLGTIIGIMYPPK